MFSRAKSIIESTESNLLGFKAKKGYLNLFQRLFVYPFMFLKMGFENITRPIAVWLFILFIMFFIISLFSQYLAISPEVYVLLINISLWVVLFSLSFSTPSSYCFYEITDKTINSTLEILNENKIDSVDRIDSLESNIDMISERIEDRGKFYKWLIGLVWGGLLLYINFQFRLANLSATQPNDSFIADIIEKSFYVASFTSVALILMMSYIRASKILVANLKYACIQHKSLLKSA
ncbi:MAG: hypothetical protein ACI8WI_002605 [Pseudoalteromonas distincta]|jgi:hypothetical protein|uniref:hypothetical protein n=1 Tax=Pseudoalteromonas distincta TaxID=77608 RepID=UPI0039E6A103